MYDDIDRYENISDYSEGEIDDAYRMLKRMREMYQDADFSLTEILLARMMQTRDDGGESVWTVLGENRGRNLQGAETPYHKNLYS